jgi:hypothetical protein
MQAKQLIHFLSTHSDKAAHMFSVQKNACFNGVKGGFESQNTWHAKSGRPFKRHDIFSVALALYDKSKDHIETPT